MRTILSSRYSTESVILAVVCLGMFWSVAICYAIVEFLVDPHARFGPFIPMLTFVTLVAVCDFIDHNKEISFDKVYLYVRSRKKEVRIPLSQVSDAYYSFFRKRGVIELESNTPFGRRITFSVAPGCIFGTREFINDLMDNVNSFKEKTAQVKPKETEFLVAK